MKCLKDSLIGISLLGIVVMFSNCKKDEVQVNTAPLADFSFSPEEGRPGTVFTFDASGCQDKETATSTLQVHWDWTNDGIWDTDFSSNKKIEHVFDRAGEFTVVLEVRDFEGLVDAITRKIKISEAAQGIITDPRDGKVYKWVKIGDQVWMSENLAFLPSVSPSSDGSETLPFYYVYGYEGTKVNEATAVGEYSVYGALYNWPAAKVSCPEGWRLPGNADWTIMTEFIGMPAGGKMKEAGLAHWVSPNTGATNESGFTALPGGFRLTEGGFFQLGERADFWSASEGDASNAWDRFLVFENDSVGQYNGLKSDAISVRCIRN